MPKCEVRKEYTWILTGTSSCVRWKVFPHMRRARNNRYKIRLDHASRYGLLGCLIVLSLGGDFASGSSKTWLSKQHLLGSKLVPEKPGGRLSGSSVSSGNPRQVSRDDKRQWPRLGSGSHFPRYSIHPWTCGILWLRRLDRSNPLCYLSEAVYSVSFGPPYSVLIINFCVGSVFCSDFRLGLRPGQLYRTEKSREIIHWAGCNNWLQQNGVIWQYKSFQLSH